jgi:hypothetical protein
VIVVALIVMGVAVVVAVLFWPLPPNGKIFTGSLHPQLISTKFTGSATGPAIFSVDAQPRVDCLLVINNDTAYRSECRRFTYAYEFEESIEISFEIELSVNTTTAGFKITIAASWGASGIGAADAVSREQPTRLALPSPRQRAADDGLRPQEDYAAITLSQGSPSANLSARSSRYANITLNWSVSLEITITITIRTIVVVEGDECRGITRISVYHEGFVEVDFEIQLTLSSPAEVAGVETIDAWISGPQAGFV